MSELKTNITNHWLAVLIIILATFLRTHDLQNRAILFGDSARDILVAIQSVEDGEIPLLGIPSSRPQFKQGPVSIWMVMSLYSFFGINLHIYSLFFSLFGVLSLIAIYEFCLVFFNKKTAIISLFLLAFSPLAISNSRMIYHVTPIPLVMIFVIYFLIRLSNKKRLGAFFSALSIAILFQFELSLAPIFLLIPIVIWRSYQKINIKQTGEILTGLIIGLLPQIIYDLNNGFQQLLRFIGWVIFTTTTFFLPGERSISFEKITSFLQNYFLYFGRIFSVDNNFFTVIIIFLLALSIFFIIKKNFSYFFKNDKTEPIFIIIAIFFILTVGYFISGTQSEAYFPPYFILIPILIAYFLASFKNKVYSIIFCTLVLWSAVNTYKILQVNFFVSTSNNFNYGPSIAEQKIVVDYIIDSSNNNYIFSSSHPNSKFATYLDNYRLLALAQKSSESSQGLKYYIESKDQNQGLSLKSKDSPIIKKQFKTITVYHE